MNFETLKYQHFEHNIVHGTVFGIGYFVFGVSLLDEKRLFDKFRTLDVDISEGEIRAATEILKYLDGERKIFSVIPKVLWGTPFQKRVWCETKNIPFGSAITYSELARRCGNSSAVRAVGTALGANPIPIIIPCHRVLRSDRKLGGFSAGIEIKKRLLELEKNTI